METPLPWTRAVTGSRVPGGGVEQPAGWNGIDAPLSELWHQHNPIELMGRDGIGQRDASERFFSQCVLPRQQIRRDHDEAQRVVRLFDHLEHITDDLPGATTTKPRRTVTWRRSVIPALLVVALVSLPRLWSHHLRTGDHPHAERGHHPHGSMPWYDPLSWLPHHKDLPLSDFQQHVFAHSVAGLLAFAASGPAFVVCSALALRMAKQRNSRLFAKVVYLNSIVLREEQAAMSILCAWYVNFSWWSSACKTRHLLTRPCIALLLLVLSSAVRKLLEFAFLTSKLRTRFEAEVMSSAFERAALQRLLELPTVNNPDERSEELQERAVLPDAHLPHAFERHTADMLSTAFGFSHDCKKPKLHQRAHMHARQARVAPVTGIFGDPGAPRGGASAESPKQRHHAAHLTPLTTSASPESEMTPNAHRGLPKDALRRLLATSTTMFLMQSEGKYDDMESFSHSLFRQLVDRPPRAERSQTTSATTRSLSYAQIPVSPSSPNISDLEKTYSILTSDEELDGNSLARDRVERAMPLDDAYRTWQMLTWHVAAAPGGQGTTRESVSEQEFVAAVRSLFERFHMLAATVKDYAAIWLIFSNLLKTLQTLIAVGIILAVVVPVEALRALGVCASTAFIGLSFVFGGLLRDIFESVVLILVVHPYDVGDRIRVNDTVYTVQKINILTTEARDLANQCVYLKNAALYQEAKFVNLGRSLNAVVEINFKLSAENMSDKLAEQLRDFVHRYVNLEERIWVPTYVRSYAPAAIGNGVCDLSGAVNHRFRLMHRMSWQNLREVRQDATDLLYAVLGEMRRLKMDFSLPTQPVQLQVDLEAQSALAQGAAPRTPLPDSPERTPTMPSPHLGVATGSGWPESLVGA